jgi:hypothetical protein
LNFRRFLANLRLGRLYWWGVAGLAGEEFLELARVPADPAGKAIPLLPVSMDREGRMPVVLMAW